MTQNFDNIIGQNINDVRAMNIEFGSNYPVVENGIVVDIVDGNHPSDYDGGNWEIVDDFYAVATDGAE